MGLAPCGPDRTCTDVISTWDGGLTWSKDGTIPAKTPPLDGATTGVTEIRFDTPMQGWAFGPDLYRTTDGGRRWTREALPGADSKQVLALAVTHSRAYAVMSPCDYGTGTCTGPAVTVWRTTTPERESWTRVPLVLPVHSSADLSAWGETVYVTENRGKTSSLYASTDGGAQFASRPVPCKSDNDPQLAQAVAMSETRMALLCVNDPMLGNAVKTVYRSADTGHTYTFAGTMGPLGVVGQLAASPSGKLAVAATAAGGSFIYINDSGGTTWSTAVSLGDGGLGWNDITYVTDNEAWVVYSPANTFSGSIGHVLVSRDGGHRWHVVL
ncbi:MAG TPA: hypothetical protein VMU95_07040 [Trebonia sp.]|nr:hypothetical protein [Trebonia sp.]